MIDEQLLDGWFKDKALGLETKAVRGEILARMKRAPLSSPVGGEHLAPWEVFKVWEDKFIAERQRSPSPWDGWRAGVDACASSTRTQGADDAQPVASNTAALDAAITDLQRALAYWMPAIAGEDSEMGRKCAEHAMLLYGLEDDIRDCAGDRLMTYIGDANRANERMQDAAYEAGCPDDTDIADWLLDVVKPSLATRDATPIDAQDAERYRWVTYVAENANILHTVVLCHEGDQDKINGRIDSYRAASAPRDK